MDLVYGASKIVRPTKCITQIGLPGTLSYRCQTNSPTDDVPTILLGVMEACPTAPATPAWASTR